MPFAKNIRRKIIYFLFPFFAKGKKCGGAYTIIMILLVPANSTLLMYILLLNQKVNDLDIILIQNQIPFGFLFCYFEKIHNYLLIFLNYLILFILINLINTEKCYNKQRGTVYL